MRETLAKEQKEYIGSGFQSVPESSVIRKTLDRETLKIICFKNTFKPREVRRYETILVATEIPAGRWGVLTTHEQATQTVAPLTPIAGSSDRGKTLRSGDAHLQAGAPLRVRPDRGSSPRRSPSHRTRPGVPPAMKGRMQLCCQSAGKHTAEQGTPCNAMVVCIL